MRAVDELSDGDPDRSRCHPTTTCVSSGPYCCDPARAQSSHDKTAADRNRLDDLHEPSSGLDWGPLILRPVKPALWRLMPQPTKGSNGACPTSRHRCVQAHSSAWEGTFNGPSRQSDQAR